MPITLDGTTGITAPGVTDTGNLSVAGTSTLTGSIGNITAGTVTASTGVLYPIVNGTAQASTSGTSIDFTSIPSWVKRVIVSWKGVSTSGTSLPVIQLGTGATPTYTTTGYVGGSVNQVGTFTSFTNGFGIFNAVTAANVMTGMFTLTLQDLSTNTWVCSHSIVNTAGSTASYGDGYVVLSGALTALRNTTTNGTDTFDAGSINIQYE
jgi:uncharacterized membrane protein (DUF441 family)